MLPRQPGLILKVLHTRNPAIIPGTALARSSNEAPAEESSRDGVVRSSRL
jgi:hypothetical protein